MHEHFTVAIHELRTERANFFGNERTENLLRERCARGVILERVRIQKLCARTIAENKTVGRCTVVIGSRESLIVHSARTARCNNHGFCTRNKLFACLHVKEYRTCRISVFIKNKLDCGGEIHNWDAEVKNLIPQRAHYLRTGIILCRMHSFAGCSSAVSRYHSSVRSLVELNAEFVQPLNRTRSITYQLLEQLALCCKMPSAVCIKKMNRGRIIRLVRRLNAALRHHRVCVAYAKFCDDHRVCARIMSFNRCRRSRAAASDNKHINVVIDFFKVNLAWVDSTVCLKHFTKLMRNFLAAVCADFKHRKLTCFIIRMVLFEQFFLFFRRHSRRFKGNVCFPCRFNSVKGFTEFL